MRICKKTVFWYCAFVFMFCFGIIYGNKAITVMYEQSPIEREYTIIIDAGHGGVDGGAMSCTGQLESTYNLQIALRLNDLLHLLGYDTVMIRMSDISVYTKGETIAQMKSSDLKERVRVVNDTPNGILISIHQNNFSDGKYYGAQVFYADNEDSKRFAEIMQKQFVDNLNPGSRRQIKKSTGVYLMEHIIRPGVLVECGFLSNPEEEGKLRTADYQKKICCAAASSLSQYISNS